MTFEMLPPESLDTPPELANLYGLNPPQTICGHDALGRFTCLGGDSTLDALGVLPFVPFLVGGAAVAATLTAWESKEAWTVGEYNNYMRQMNNTIKEWDALGWKAGCWGKNPAKRKAWQAFWARFSRHYKEWPTSPGRQLFSYDVTPSAEMPARALMADLAGWGNWLNKTCQAGTAPVTLPKPPPNGGGDNLATIVKWGAIGLGAIVALNVVTGIRGAFPQQRK